MTSSEEAEPPVYRKPNVKPTFTMAKPELKDMPTIAADWITASVQPSTTSIVVYIDHVIPKLEQDGTFSVDQVVREMKLEIKIPTKFAETLGWHLVHASKEIAKNPKQAIFGPSSFADVPPPDNPKGQVDPHGIG